MPTTTDAGMGLFRSQISTSVDLRQLIKQIEESTIDRMETILTLMKSDILAYLRSYTNVMKPPRDYVTKFMLDPNSVRVRRPRADKTGWRPAHPGGWADVTENLMQSYYTVLERIDGGWKFTVGNKSGHARYVEGRDGMFVVTGILNPGGPVDKAIRLAFKRLGMGAGVVNPGQGTLYGLEANYVEGFTP